MSSVVAFAKEAGVSALLSQHRSDNNAVLIAKLKVMMPAGQAFILPPSRRPTRTLAALAPRRDRAGRRVGEGQDSIVTHSPSWKSAKQRWSSLTLRPASAVASGTTSVVAAACGAATRR